MRTTFNRITQSFLLCGALFSVESVSAFYDSGLGRWINRDPFPDAGFQELLPDDAAPRFGLDNGNAFQFVDHAPINHFDPLGLITFQGCTEKKKKSIQDSIKKNCDAAKKCADKCTSPGAASAVKALCEDAKSLKINCVDADFVGSDGTKCSDHCGMARANEIYMCPAAWNTGPCGNLKCTLFHEGLHASGGLKHGDDMTVFDKCMGCKPTLPKK